MRHHHQLGSSTIVRAIGKPNLISVSIITFPLFFLCRQIYTENFPNFDNNFMLWLQHNIPSQLTSFIKIFYLAGGAEVSAVVVLLGLAVLVWKRLWKESAVLAFGSLGVLILVDEILKPLLGRRRPDMRLVEVSGSKSFPSGHATGNLFLYFYLSYLLASRFPKLTPYIYGSATAFLLLMGFSSIYVRAHWPTDIIAGYAVGYIWLTIALAVLKLSGRRNPVSSELSSSNDR